MCIRDRPSRPACGCWCWPVCWACVAASYKTTQDLRVRQAPPCAGLFFAWPLARSTAAGAKHRPPEHCSATTPVTVGAFLLSTENASGVPRLIRSVPCRFTNAMTKTATAYPFENNIQCVDFYIGPGIFTVANIIFDSHLSPTLFAQRSASTLAGLFSTPSLLTAASLLIPVLLRNPGFRVWRPFRCVPTIDTAQSAAPPCGIKRLARGTRGARSPRSRPLASSWNRRLELDFPIDRSPFAPATRPHFESRPAGELRCSQCRAPQTAAWANR